jgi:general stress protein 26
MFQRLKVASFAEIEGEFIERVHSIVWCSVATVDRRGRPRSRLLHPIWEGATGWIATARNSLKAKHLSQNPHVSLAYVADTAKPVYADCVAVWEEDSAEKRRVWAMYQAAPPPLGYDPAPFFHSPDHPDFGLLKLTPWRIELYDQGRMQRAWLA